MIHLSFKNPYLVIVFAIIVAVLSAVLIPRMPVDVFEVWIASSKI